MSTPKEKRRAAKSGFSAAASTSSAGAARERLDRAGWYARQFFAVRRGRRPHCPQCGGPLGRGTAIISAGALRVVGGRPGRPWIEETGRAEMFAPHDAIGFLRLAWHVEMAPEVTIVDAAPGGQFDLYFCSIACLRAFLTARVDELEKLAKKKEERRAAPRKRRTTKRAKSREKAKRRRE
jgi:hypothetical protein